MDSPLVADADANAAQSTGSVVADLSARQDATANRGLQIVKIADSRDALV